MRFFNPPRMPWAMVGERTMMPRTSPLYSTMDQPSRFNVVVTIMRGLEAGRAGVSKGKVTGWHAAAGARSRSPAKSESERQRQRQNRGRAGVKFAGQAF